MVLLQGLEQPLRRSEIRDPCRNRDTCTYIYQRLQALCVTVRLGPGARGALLLTAHYNNPTCLEHGLKDSFDMIHWVGRGIQKQWRRWKGRSLVQRQKCRHDMTSNGEGKGRETGCARFRDRVQCEEQGGLQGFAWVSGRGHDTPVTVGSGANVTHRHVQFHDLLAQQKYLVRPPAYNAPALSLPTSPHCAFMWYPLRARDYKMELYSCPHLLETPNIRCTQRYAGSQTLRAVITEVGRQRNLLIGNCNSVEGRDRVVTLSQGQLVGVSPS